jgi:outer membrane translocation and assembly module TamA
MREQDGHASDMVYNTHRGAQNAVMRRFAQGACLAVGYLVGCHPLTQAQLAGASEMPVPQAVLQCPPKVVFPDKQIAGPKVVIADLNFEGSVGMGIPEQDQITASLRQRSYSGDPDGVTSDVEERVRRAWQEHGYFKVQVRGNTTILSSDPLESRIAVTLQVDEGQQYRLRGITFKNNRAIRSEQVLRSLFAIKDGDLFNVAQASEGLEKLNAAYRQFGYINFTSIPNTRVNEEDQTISLDVDFDEGKQFYVSSINALGLDQHSSQEAMKDFPLKPGDLYNRRLLDVWMEHLLSRDSVALAELQPDETAGTVAITISFRHCSAK